MERNEDLRELKACVEHAIAMWALTVIGVQLVATLALAGMLMFGR